MKLKKRKLHEKKRMFAILVAKKIKKIQLLKITCEQQEEINFTWKLKRIEK